MIAFERLGVVLKNGEPVYGGATTAKFNAGMAVKNDKVHMLYRYAEQLEDTSDVYKSPYAVDHICHATLTLDGELLSDDETPVIKCDTKYDSTGCQDPRIVYFEGEYYIFYCGWDINTAPKGEGTPRPMIAKTKDFVTYEKLGVVALNDKDHFIFPARINGEIAFVHRVQPDIQIDYFDSFEDIVNPDMWQAYGKEKSTVMKSEQPFEGQKIGGGVPPIKTDEGWLFIYHGVCDDSAAKSKFRYSVGIALLDLENPSKVIARLPYEVLKPETDYELYGDVDNVVFPVGGYVHDGYIYISYGCADKYVALGRMKFDEVLSELNKYRID